MTGKRAPGFHIGKVTVDGFGSSAALPAGTNTIGKIDVNVYAPFVDTVASANTTQMFCASQVVKAPVFIRAGRAMTGTVTISDGVRSGCILGAGDTMPFHCVNLSSLYYQFSVNAPSTEKFHISTGI